MKKILLILMTATMLSSCSSLKEDVGNSELAKKIQEREQEKIPMTKEEISKEIDRLIEEAGKDNNTIVYTGFFYSSDEISGEEAKSIKNLIQEMDKRGYYLKEAIPVSYNTSYTGIYDIDTAVYYIFEKTGRYKLEDAIKEATQSFNP